MSEIPKIIVHQKADEDLEDIFDYSMERFGFQRAVRYIKDIETMFKALARDPHKGKTFDPQTPYYLHKRIESHFIYYSECKGGIEIFRVLHERMLPAKYLIDMNDGDSVSRFSYWLNNKNVCSDDPVPLGARWILRLVLNESLQERDMICRYEIKRLMSTPLSNADDSCDRFGTVVGSLYRKTERQLRSWRAIFGDGREMSARLNKADILGQFEKFKDFLNIFRQVNWLNA